MFVSCQFYHSIIGPEKKPNNNINNKKKIKGKKAEKRKYLLLQILQINV